MKNLTLLLFFLSSKLAHSQIALEHIYPFEHVQRVNLPGIGERYYADTYDYVQKFGTIHWFQADHQALNTHKYGGPPTSSATPYVGISSVSSNFFDTDPGIEYDKSWVSGSLGSGYGTGYSVHDDNNANMSGSITSYAEHLVTAAGNKVVSGGKVYGVPGFIHEYTVPGVQFGYATLQAPGEQPDGKFWYSNDNHLVLLNQDYSVYKDFEIDLSVCPSTPYPSLRPILQGQYEINDDSKLEFFYQKTCNGVLQIKYFSEESIIFNLEKNIGTQNVNATSLLPSAYPGLDGPKCRIQYGISDSIEIYDVRTGVLERRFMSIWDYKNSDLSGVKYYKRFALESDTVIQVLNPDYSIWAEFRKDVGIKVEPMILSEFLFDGDADSKELLSRTTLDSSYLWQVTREDGNVIFELETSFSTEVLLDETPGLKRKLIFNSLDHQGNANGKTYVFGLPDPPPPFNPDEHEQAFKVQPNPFSDALQLDFSLLAAPVDAIHIYDVQGHHVFSQQTPVSDAVWSVPTVSWPVGLYIIRIQSGGESIVRKAARH